MRRLITTASTNQNAEYASKAMPKIASRAQDPPIIALTAATGSSSENNDRNPGGDEYRSKLLLSIDAGLPVDPLGRILTKDNPAHPGERIRLSVVGAGATSPPISAGEWPPEGGVVMPQVSIHADIGGKDAIIARQALSPVLIGVTDLDIVVPNLAANLHMMGLSWSATDSRLCLVQVWIGR